MKVLFTTPVLEHPAAGGPQLRIENSIKALARNCNLCVVSRVSQRHLGGPEADAFYRGLVGKFRYAPSVHRLSCNFIIRNLQKQFRQRLRGDSDARYLIDFVDREQMDLLWFGYGNISWELIKTIKTARPDIKVVCDTDSVWSRFILRELEVEVAPARRAEIERNGREKEFEERAWTNLCDATLAVSQIDAEYYRSLVDKPERVHIFSNVIDLTTYVVPSVPPEGLRHPSIYLAGTFGHAASPMDRAARWIVDEVLPLVRARIPNVHFYIVGKNSDLTMANARGPNVTVTGRLSSVLPYLSNVDVVLVPLKFESGTRFKILEAGACGKPVVSTVLGAEGIPVTDGHDILLADEPVPFADAIIRLIEDPGLGNRLGQALGALVRAEYSVEFLEKQARLILASLANE